jgi:hypothetical protein
MDTVVGDEVKRWYLRRSDEFVPVASNCGLPLAEVSDAAQTRAPGLL